MSARKYYCGHCETYVSKTLYFKHKRMYYERHSKTWKSTRVLPTNHDFEDYVLSENSNQSESDQEIEDTTEESMSQSTLI